MDIHHVLTEIGLNEREIKVYLASLELGESTVLPISKKAGLKRTYCYDILSDLMKMNLVSYFEKNNRRRYLAQDPKQIEIVLKNRLKNFEEILPELRSIYNLAPSKPKVRYFEGKQGIISVYEENAKSKELLAIGSPKHIYQYIPEYFEAHVKMNLSHKMKVRELITKDDTKAPYLKLHKKPLQEARVLPEGVTFSTDLMIFDNKLAMISYKEDLHAVVIESASIVETHIKLFDLLWKQAGPSSNVNNIGKITN